MALMGGGAVALQNLGWALLCAVGAYFLGSWLPLLGSLLFVVLAISANKN